MAIRFKPKDREDFMRAAELTEEEMTAIEQDSMCRLALAFNGSGVASGYYIFRIPEKGDYARAMSYIRDTIETSNALERDLSTLYGVLEIRARAEKEA